MKQKAKINNWYIQAIGPGKYVLVGEIENHPKQHKFKGEEQMTSELLSIDFKNETAETLNTIYTIDNDNIGE